MLMRFCALLTVATALCGQQVVAPTPEQTGPPRGEDAGNYNVTDSFETGYRFAEIGGDLAKYRSDINYRNGMRLIGSSLSVDSKEGHGHLFDQILLNTQGLGNDPYQSATLRVQKNGLYRYDLAWRLDEFYNPGVAVSGGLHFMDTRRRLQDHDLTLLPQSKIKFRAGYSRDTQTGPALASVEEFSSLGSAYPVFTNVRREWNEYRVGADIELAGVKFSLLHRWDFYKDDSPYAAPASLIPSSLVPGGSSTLGQFSRSEPYHGSNPGWLGDLVSTHKYWAANARMTYTGGVRDFALNESALGLSLGAAANRQILVTGNADRPVAAGDFSLSVFPTDRLTVVNNTSAHNARTVGDSVYNEFDNSTSRGTILMFHYLGIRTVANSTDLNYRVAPWIGFYAGYHYSDRLITTIEGFQTPGVAFHKTPYERDNQLHTGTLGVRIRPIKPLTFNLDGEVGRDDLPFAPISARNYHSLGGRVDYRTRKLRLATEYRELYNVNSPVSISTFSSHSRNYTADLSWSPGERFSLDASYMKLHLDTVSGLVFFAGITAVQLQQMPTLYLSNIHAANLSARFGLARRADLFVGYSITRDTGDGRTTTILASAPSPAQALFSSVETFPVDFQSPLARLSIRISTKLRWNAGYQFYRYREEFGLISHLQNYRAHTGYTSVSWSF